MTTNNYYVKCQFIAADVSIIILNAYFSSTGKNTSQSQSKFNSFKRYITEGIRSMKDLKYYSPQVIHKIYQVCSHNVLSATSRDILTENSSQLYYSNISNSFKPIPDYCKSIPTVWKYNGIEISISTPMNLSKHGPLTTTISITIYHLLINNVRIS